MLTRIQVQGYRSLRSVDLAPGQLSVIIGANGSGKSNLLSFLQLVSLMMTGSLRRFVGEAGGASALLHYGPQTTREIDLKLEFAREEKSNAYQARLGYAAGDALIFLEESVTYRGPGWQDERVESLGAGHAESRLDESALAPDGATARTVRQLIGGMSFFHFHDTSRTSPLRQNARQEDCHFLRSDGSNLAAYLLALASGEDEAFRKAWVRINALVQRIAPFVKRLEPTPVDPSRPGSAVRLDWIDSRDHRFGVQHLSDGTLRGIALVTALAQPTRNLPAFISIDEPELGLHPAALELLVALARSIQPNVQVLMATQSPWLLDLFAPEEVLVAENRAGETTFRRLESKALEAWLEDYELSELYEKNVLGGRP